MDIVAGKHSLSTCLCRPAPVNRLEKRAIRKGNFTLRLAPSLLDEARQAAAAEGVALKQLVNGAVAEKLSALRTEKYFAERAARASIPKALGILKRAGVGNPPAMGDKRGRARKRTS